MVALNIRPGRIISEVLDTMSASNRRAEVLVLRVYREKVHHLFNYGMTACNDQTLVKNCIEQLFLHIDGQPDLLLDSGSIDSNLFKIFRRLLIKQIEYPKKTSTSNNRENLFSSAPQTTRGISSLQREALFLKFRIGLSYGEVAKVLDLSTGQLQSQVSKAVDVLLDENETTASGS
jgi:DNA-directed RNA polymerase specialized sigma24 family protein